MSERAIDWRTDERSPEQTRILDGVVERVEKAGGARVVTFDLDSTLFDNRSRQLAILTDFAACHGLDGVEKLGIEDIDGWLVAKSIRRLSGAEGRVDELERLFKPFWRERFFTSELCRHDVPLPGAADFVNAIEGAGAGVVYLTGRHEPMRAGTVDSLSGGGFPEGTLVMKPTLEMSDTEWKEISVERIRKMGAVLACFDNETTHVNRLRAAFPGATVVWVETDHSPEAESIDDSVPRIHGFLR